MHEGLQPTFQEVFELFMDKCEVRGLEPATRKTYQYIGNSFLIPVLGAMPVDLLTHVHFDDLYLDMQRRGYNPTTIRKTNTTAGACLKMAERNGWVQKNAARLAELPRTGQVHRDIPTPDELALFLAAAAERDPLIHDYARVMAASGVRPGEACALRKDDLRGETLHVERAVDVSHGTARLKGTKTGRTRKVILDPHTVSLVHGLREPFLFNGDEPARTDLMGKRWKRVACRAGLNFTARSCRHFHATQLLGSGMSPRAVADRLGHANPTMTLNVYAQSIPAHDEVAAERIAAVLPAIVKQGNAIVQTSTPPKGDAS